MYFISYLSFFSFRNSFEYTVTHSSTSTPKVLCFHITFFFAIIFFCSYFSYIYLVPCPSTNTNPIEPNKTIQQAPCLTLSTEIPFRYLLDKIFIKSYYYVTSLLSVRHTYHYVWYMSKRTRVFFIWSNVFRPVFVASYYTTHTAEAEMIALKR